MSSISMDNRGALASSKAGRRFMGFMATFNRGDTQQLRDFVAQYTIDEALEMHSVDEWTRHLSAIYDATGGMRVYQVVGADEYRVVVLMQAHANNALYLVEMAVSEDYPHKIAEFKHRPAQ